MQFAEEWQRDIFEQQLFDLGCDTIDGADIYIPTDIFAQAEPDLKAVCEATPGVEWKGAEACEDRNWNAAWEAEHPVHELPMGIRIVPHCAFGAGYHETTAMMLEELQQAELAGKIVLDHGTGTGVLAIMAKRMGAAQVVAVDIDEKSVVNAQENAALNGEQIEVRLGATPPEGKFDLILANIHRNVLLSNMAAYAAHLKTGGELWMSGFYAADIAPLQAAAEEQGLRLIEVLSRDEWQWMRCQKAGR